MGMISDEAGVLSSRDVKNTSATEWNGQMFCAVCHNETPTAHGAGRPRKYCSTACRQRAYRQRHQHLESDRRPAPARSGTAPAGPVVAVVFVPAATIDGAGRASIAGPVFDIREFLMDATQIQYRPVSSPTPRPDPEQETSDPPETRDETPDETL